MVFFAAGTALTWLLVILSAVGGGAACSIRSPSVAARFLATASPRPNISFPTFNCTSPFLESFCLNGGTCFVVRTHLDTESYYCECPDGFWGSRCDFKNLEGSYVLETAGITGGASVIVLVTFLVCASIFLYRRSRKGRTACARGSFDSSAPVVQAAPAAEAASTTAWLSGVP